MFGEQKLLHTQYVSLPMSTYRRLLFLSQLKSPVHLHQRNLRSEYRGDVPQSALGAPLGRQNKTSNFRANRIALQTVLDF